MLGTLYATIDIIIMGAYCVGRVHIMLRKYDCNS